jgi:hypothetical protein
LATVTIALPDALADRIHEDAVSRGYPDDAAFVRAIIETAYCAGAARTIDDLLDEGLEGDAAPFTRADWDRLRANVLRGEAENQRS